MYTYRLQDVKMPAGFGNNDLKKRAAGKLGVPFSDVEGIDIVRRSVDARRKDDIKTVLSLDVTVKNEVRGAEESVPYSYALPVKSRLPFRPLVVGCGPAGLMAAYVLANAGAKPLLIERGLDVCGRKAAVDGFFAGGPLDENTNVQFGEGGAGTFSDGKLTTGIKNPRKGKVLEIFAECGAPREIKYEAKPHIGTDYLPGMVKNIRERIVAMGGEVIFSARLTKIDIKDGKVTGARYEKDGSEHFVETGAAVLAIGHSARDTFRMLYDSGVTMISKPFSVGVRIEHLQSSINKSMYGDMWDSPFLGAADYKLAAHLGNGRGVYTFCMCPGGSVVAAASEEGGLVTNGMSMFARDGVNANSAVLVGIDEKDYGSGVLDGMEFQRKLERAAFEAGGGNWKAPVFRTDTLITGKESRRFGEVLPTYMPGTEFADPREFLPGFVCDSLAEGIKAFGRKIKGFDCPDGIMTGTETRSSSPVRIPRGEDMQSVSTKGLYPCGEGAGYAGGIMSSAVDGIAVAESLLENWSE